MFADETLVLPADQIQDTVEDVASEPPAARRKCTSVLSDKRAADDYLANDPCTAGRYGCGRFTPSWLQVLNGPRSFLAFLCWFTFIQSFPVNGLTNVNTTSIERRFRLTSAEVGIISGMYDIVAGLVVLPISYYGNRGHKPRFLAVASLFIVLGCAVMLLPHVASGPYEYVARSVAWAGPSCGARNVASCQAAGNATVVGGDPGLGSFFYVFLLGMGLIGCGGITLYTIGTVFIDENVRSDQATLYMGIFFGFTSLGSAAGFLVGSQFLALYVDTPAPPPTALSQEDPQWVGAWWMGYALNIVLAAFLAFFLFGFPRELPSAREAQRTRVSEAHHHDSSDHNRAITDPTFGTSIRDVPAATLLLLRNPAFMCITLAGVIDSLVKSGIAQFLAKFIQNQFNQTASWSAMMAGFIVVPGAAGGCVAGGYLPKRLRLKVPGLIMLCLLSSVAVATLSASVWMRCDVNIMAGVTAGYHDSPEGLVTSTGDLTSLCNERCSCDTAAYMPICGSDGFQYFSACHAGCPAAEASAASNSSPRLLNCTCVAASNSSAGGRGEATAGKCRLSCPVLYAFLFVMFLAIFSVFLTLTPWTTMSMRVVPESQRTYAVGFQWVFVRLAGLAPGPVMFGAIIDAACVVWQDKCGEKGSCWIYHSYNMSGNVFAVLVSLKLASVALYFTAYKLYRPPPEGPAASSSTLAQAGASSLPLTMASGGDVDS